MAIRCRAMMRTVIRSRPTMSASVYWLIFAAIIAGLVILLQGGGFILARLMGGGPIAAMIVLVVNLVLLLAIFVVCVRLSLLAPATLATGKMSLRESWERTDDHFWGFLGFWLLFVLMFLVVYLLLRRRYRDTVYLAVGCAFLLLLSVSINGAGAWKFYVFTIFPRMNHGELNDSFTYVFQSAFMLFKRAFQYDQLLNPHPMADNPWIFTVGLAIFKALILTPAINVTRRFSLMALAG